MALAVRLSIWSVILRRIQGKVSQQTAYTVLGGFAIPLWATWPSLAAFASGGSIFQLLSIAFFAAFLTSRVFERPNQTPHNSTRSATWPSVLVCACGLVGMNGFFIWAINYIPPAQANVLSYCWPIMVVVLAASLRLFPFTKLTGISLLIGFCGVVIVSGLSGVTPSLPGIALAVLSGLSWALFTVFRIWQGETARPVMTHGCLVSSGLSLLLYLASGPIAPPSVETVLIGAAIGIFPIGLANLIWDIGVRKGDGRLLATMAYSTPFFGILFLAILGLSELSISLLVGGALIIGAGAIATRSK